jgi:hypothetical protein
LESPSVLFDAAQPHVVLFAHIEFIIDTAVQSA